MLSQFSAKEGGPDEGLRVWGHMLFQGSVQDLGFWVYGLWPPYTLNQNNV